MDDGKVKKMLIERSLISMAEFLLKETIFCVPNGETNVCLFVASAAELLVKAASRASVNAKLEEYSV
ncbi:hypothetical protein HPP92_000581 [Vanilla planifolia]|uniref:Uncharacterized protein n=1 Tax=Vanilla planifolia TaxID=51239 RepID=A0A835RP41_VANPL|nr:hypothetical protein HPP92_000581 [Vanilla planifolia]